MSINGITHDFGSYLFSAEPKGSKTAEDLKKKGITSPRMNNPVNIGKGITLDCPYEIGSKEYDAWILEKREKYKMKL